MFSLYLAYVPGIPVCPPCPVSVQGVALALVGVWTRLTVLTAEPSRPPWKGARHSAPAPPARSLRASPSPRSSARPAHPFHPTLTIPWPTLTPTPPAPHPDRTAQRFLWRCVLGAGQLDGGSAAGRWGTGRPWPNQQPANVMNDLDLSSAGCATRRVRRLWPGGMPTGTVFCPNYFADRATEMVFLPDRCLSLSGWLNGMDIPTFLHSKPHTKLNFLKPFSLKAF